MHSPCRFMPTVPASFVPFARISFFHLRIQILLVEKVLKGSSEDRGNFTSVKLGEDISLDIWILVCW